MPIAHMAWRGLLYVLHTAANVKVDSVVLCITLSFDFVFFYLSYYFFILFYNLFIFYRCPMREPSHVILLSLSPGKWVSRVGETCIHRAGM